MAKVAKYTGSQSEDGTFSCKVKREVNAMLDMYCKVNGLNKTAYVNALIENDMMQKFSKLKELKEE